MGASAARLRYPRPTALMRRLLPIPLVLVATLSACQGGSKRLEGRWRGATVVGVAPDQTVAAQAFVNEMEIVAQGDEITIVTPPRKQPSKSKYTVVEEDKTHLVITTKADGPAMREKFVFVGPGTMRWDLGDGRAIEFKKQGGK
jgi:hypothetical protein